MKHVKDITEIQAAGNVPKKIEEFIGNVNSNTQEVSIARMSSYEGWAEPPQIPEFNEYTIVLNGCLHIDTRDKCYVVRKNEAFIAIKGEQVQYSSPDKGGAEYIAVCLPAFLPEANGAKSIMNNRIN